MAQIAQQDVIKVDAGLSVDSITDETAALLRKKYVRGTLLDVVLHGVDSEGHKWESRIIGYFFTTDGSDELTIVAFNWSDENVVWQRIGKVVESDYED